MEGFDLMPVVRFVGAILLILVLVICFLGYKQCGTNKYKSSKLLVPERKIVTTNINGLIKSDTTYIYNLKK